MESHDARSTLRLSESSSTINPTKTERSITRVSNAIIICRIKQRRASSRRVQKKEEKEEEQQI
jgi:hypothetical protein